MQGPTLKLNRNAGILAATIQYLNVVTYFVNMFSSVSESETGLQIVRSVDKKSVWWNRCSVGGHFVDESEKNVVIYGAQPVENQ
jgi:hypothetical protein